MESRKIFRGVPLANGKIRSQVKMSRWNAKICIFFDVIVEKRESLNILSLNSLALYFKI